MIRALHTGVSGLRNHQTQMDVIGNNIANINTLGFKASRVHFADVMNQTLRTDSAGNPTQVGLGAAISSIGRNFGQGTLLATGITTDLAIQGDAFFVVANGDESYYTRTSSFQFDPSGNLVDPASGLRLQGRTATGSGQFSGGLGDIQIPFGDTLPAQATGEISWAGNLDADSLPTGSILESNRVLTPAAEASSIFSLFDERGASLGLADGDQFTVGGIATGEVAMERLVGAQSGELGLVAGDRVVVSAYLGEIASARLDSEDFMDTGVTFEIVATDELPGGSSKTYTVSIPPLAGLDPSDALDEIISAIRASDAPVSASDDGSDEFVITPSAPTTRLEIREVSGSVASIGLTDGATVVPRFDLLTLGDGPGEFADLGAFLEAMEASLNDSANPGGPGDAVQVTLSSTGTVRITNGSNPEDLAIHLRTVEDRAGFSAALGALQGTLGTGDTSAESEALRFESTLIAGVDFSDLSQLAESLEGVLQQASDAITVRHDPEGRLVYQQTDGPGAHALSGLTFGLASGASSPFADALGLDGASIGFDEPYESGRFLDVAKESSSLDQLYSSSGEYLELRTGDSVTLAGTVGDSPGAEKTLVIGSDITTYGDLADSLESLLGFGEDADVSIGSEGELHVEGEAGEAHALSSVGFRESGNTVLESGLGLRTLQEATDATVQASTTAYDSLGHAHTVELEFTREGDSNTWAWTVAAGDGTTVESGGSGTIRFDPDGTLEEWSSEGGEPTRIRTGTSADALELELDFGASGSLAGLTQYASSSSLTATEQDGWAAGELASIAIDDHGTITGAYTNGQIRDMARIGLATFRNISGLTAEGQNLFAASDSSGDPRVGDADSIPASIIGGALEGSNVDLASEFTELITAQRGFQASTRIITTADEMLAETVNLKR